MENIYMLYNEIDPLHNIVIIMSKDIAIKESILHPKFIVEMFKKSGDEKYVTTNNYYRNGEFTQND
jgi:hypothetical protein